MTSSDVPTVPVGEVPAEFDHADPPSSLLLLDVREVDEWELGHAPGAVHIPMVDVPARIDELDFDAELYVVCRQGGRSIEVVKYLEHIGREAFHVSGGMVAWQKAGRPVVADGDHEAKIY